MTARREMTAHQHDDVGLDAGELLGKHDMADLMIGATPRNIEEVDGVQLVGGADRRLGVQHFRVGWTRYCLFHVKHSESLPQFLGASVGFFSNHSLVQVNAVPAAHYPASVHHQRIDGRVGNAEQRSEERRVGKEYTY